MPVADDCMYSEGTVLQASPSEDVVKVLVEYGPYGERRVCLFRREIWPEGNSPQEGQKCSIEFRPGQEAPIIKVIALPPRATARRQRGIRDAHGLLGIKPGDKVTLVAGLVYEEDSRATDKLYDLGPGEGLALRELFPLLQECGISPRDVQCVFPDEACGGTVPYTDRHVIFLGSTLSNLVLTDHYWNHLQWKGRPLSSIFSFSDRNNPEKRERLLVQTDSGRQEWILEDLTPKRSNGEPIPRRDRQIRDVFVTAVTANPFDSSHYHRCILSFGISNVGTGYGAVVLTARRALELIGDRVRPDRTERPEWLAAWRVDMHGWFNPEHDPVQCIWGLKDMPNPVLSNAITAPRVWSDDPETDEETDEGEDVIVEYLRQRDRLAQ